MSSPSPPFVGPDPMTMALLVFHGLTLLDFAGPYEVLMRVPGATVVVVSAHPGELVVSVFRVWCSIAMEAGSSRTLSDAKALLVSQELCWVLLTIQPLTLACS